ncbi:MAG: DUF6760 family protein [Myxococcota bacterium]
MPGLRARLRRRPGVRPGGIVSYPLERIYQEVAYIAYHFHWSIDEILAMEHRERQIWVREISEINKEINRSRKS